MNEKISVRCKFLSFGLVCFVVALLCGRNTTGKREIESLRLQLEQLRATNVQLEKELQQHQDRESILISEGEQIIDGTKEPISIIRAVNQWFRNYFRCIKEGDTCVESQNTVVKNK